MNVLKVARAKKDMTMSDLADKMNVKRQAISAWENGKSKPSIQKVMDLHRFLDIPLDDLMEFFNNQNQEE